MKKLLRKISEISAAPGFEADIRAFISGETDKNAVTDPYGNLIVHKKGTGVPVIVAVPMDIPSVFVTHKGENGFARFVSRGIEKKKLVGARVVFRDGAHGVIFRETKNENDDGMFADTGGMIVSEAEPGMIDTGFLEMGDKVSMFEAGARAAVCAVVAAAQRKTVRDTYFVFLAKTVLGVPSASVLSHTPGAGELIAVGKSRASDIPGEENVRSSLSEGVCLRLMDKSMISSPQMAESFMKYSDTVKIQREVSDERSPAGALQKERGGFDAVSLGIPVRYLGELCETVAVSDAVAAADLITKYLNE